MTPLLLFQYIIAACFGISLGLLLLFIAVMFILAIAGGLGVQAPRRRINETRPPN